MTKRDLMSDDELAALLAEQERAAKSFRDSTLADDQANALDFYEARPFGDEEEGRSQVVSPDVAEVVDYMQISVLRTVISGDRVVEFEPGDTDQIPDIPEPPGRPKVAPGSEQDPQTQAAMAEYQRARATYDQALAPLRAWEKRRTQAAEDATAAVNHIFLRRQNGERILLDWLQSGLIEKIGVIKTAAVVERRKIKNALSVDAIGLAMLTEQGETISAASEQDDGTWLVTVEREEEVKRYLDYPIPSEEYLFSARTRDEDTADYQAHRCRKTLSDLIEMGFDRELVERLPIEEGWGFDDPREQARWHDEEEHSYGRTGAMREVMLLEEYARVDIDGDGIAELIKAFRVGDVILEVTEVEEAPFVVWTPFPRAHRLVGDSLAEKTMDIQRINSVLMRQALDGVYQTNSPRMSLHMDSETPNTIDDLLSVRAGGIVRWKGVNKPEPLYEPFDIQKSLGMLEYMTGLRETRTGITRLNQGLDEDTINKTASGQAALQATGQQIEEFVARNFANAMARLFAKKLRLMADNGDPIAIKIDGQYRRIDPTTWDRDMNVAVRVGLGSGRKEQRLVYRQSLLEIQERGFQVGLVDAKRLYNNVSAMIRDSGLGNPDDYIIDPDSDEYQDNGAGQPQADPEAIKAQGEAQAKTLKAQSDAQTAAAKMDTAREESTARLQLASEESQAMIALKRAEAEEEARLAREKAAFEAEMAQKQADREWELAQQRASREAELSRMKAEALPKNRAGGDLSK